MLGKIKVWAEKTSTSPATQVHLGHAKAYIAEPNFAMDTPEGEKLTQQREMLIKGHVACLNYALKFGYVYKRWYTIVHGILKKDIGTETKIHRIRRITLFEWDYNLLLSIKSRQLLHQMIQGNRVNPSCFGSVPGKSSIDAVFVKELEYEISKVTRTSLLQNDIDCMSCYDRLPSFLTNIASRKEGQTTTICVVQGRTLKHAHYHLKTKMGISDTFITHSRAQPLYGKGQGPSDAPLAWLILSSMAIDVFEEHASGASYSTPTGDLKIKLHILAFVDDTNNRCNHFTQRPQPQLLH